MTLKGLRKFDKEIKYYSEQMMPLSRKDVSVLRNKYLKTRNEWKKSDIILKKYGYGKIAGRMG